MAGVTIITHFSMPNWPVVNKLYAIAKCLEVNLVRCTNIPALRAELMKSTEHRILFFTDEGLIDLVQELEGKGTKFEVAMFLHSPIMTAASRMCDLKVVKYLIGAGSVDSIGRDLSILIKKFSDGDILDLDKYMAFGCKMQKRIVNSSATKQEAIKAVGDYISQLGDPGYSHPYNEYANRLAALADELLLNAIFDANPRLKRAERSAQFHLEKHEEVELNWGYDGEFFGISVRDPFGRFTSDAIMTYLAAPRKWDDILHSESAGLGLKFIFEKAHQVVANVKREKLTEVIALVKFGPRMISMDKSNKSFYFFGDSDSPEKKSS